MITDKMIGAFGCLEEEEAGDTAVVEDGVVLEAVVWALAGVVFAQVVGMSKFTKLVLLATK